MTDVETLTEDERGALDWFGKQANQMGRKAVRIIDDLEKRLAAAELERVSRHEGHEYMRQRNRADTAEARCTELEAHIADLLITSARDQAQVEHWRKAWAEAQVKADMT